MTLLPPTTQPEFGIRVDGQEYLTHKKHPPPGTLQWDYTYGHVVVLGWGVVSYERSTPVVPLQKCKAVLRRARI